MAGNLLPLVLLGGAAVVLGKKKKKKKSSGIKGNVVHFKSESQLPGISRALKPGQTLIGISLDLQNPNHPAIKAEIDRIAAANPDILFAYGDYRLLKKEAGTLGSSKKRGSGGLMKVGEVMFDGTVPSFIEKLSSLVPNAGGTSATQGTPSAAPALTKKAKKAGSGYSNVTRDRMQWIQLSLAALGYDVGPNGMDGLYGDNTKAAVWAFQQDHVAELGEPDGKPGKNTQALLESAVDKAYEDQRDLPPPGIPTPEEEAMLLEDSARAMFEVLAYKTGDSDFDPTVNPLKDIIQYFQAVMGASRTDGVFDWETQALLREHIDSL